MTDALKEEEARAERRRLLESEQMRPLVEYVTGLRAASDGRLDVPDFDPRDGGVEAEVLLLLEAPGARARGTGFVSLDNPDPSARTLTRLLDESGLDRSRIVIWNSVPWYVGDGKRIRAVTGDELRQCRQHLRDLLAVLPSLRVIVLVGGAARRQHVFLSAVTQARIFGIHHPSARSMKTNPERYHESVEVLRNVACLLPAT